MGFLKILEGMRFEPLTGFMSLITYLGDETCFMAIALLFFWCVSKKQGYFILVAGLAGNIVNQFLKLWFRIPRPWVQDPNFTILEQAREAADGYSFPSGHSQSAVGTFGAIANTTGNKWVKWVCLAVCVLVPLSRMYIGVHTLSDVLVGVGMACALVGLLRKPMVEHTEKAMKPLIAVMLFMALGLLLFVELYPFPADVDVHNLESGTKNAYTMLGCIAGVALVYVLEKKYVRFETKAVWWAQILKVAFGLAAVLAVKEGLRSPLDALFAGHLAARAVRYFLIVLVAGGVWPLTFRWFSKLGVKK